MKRGLARALGIVAGVGVAAIAAAIAVQWVARSRDAAAPSRAPRFVVPLEPLRQRLMTDVAVLGADSMEGRAVGTRGSARARAYTLRWSVRAMRLRRVRLRVRRR